MASVTYRFGEFRLDPASRELWHGDEVVPLHRKAFDCVVYLIEHRERAIERDELFAAVWGDVQLSDGVLGQAILEARRALDDSGEDQQVIKTVRAFGYQWVAPVEVLEPQGQVGAVKAAAEARTVLRRRSVWLWALLAVLVLGTLVGIQSLVWQDADSTEPGSAFSQVRQGDLALMLPVVVEAEDQHGWIRLGIMELMAERLRTAGQPMVPSDTVIALLRGRSAEPGPDEISELTATTGARFVLGARAEATGAGWRISLRSQHGPKPPLTAAGEAQDVLKAARVAADRMALSLGLTPATGADAEPGLQMLLHQSEAAMLAAQYEAARALIEAAEPALRQHPEIRLMLTRIDLASYDLDATQAGLESLLKERSVERDPVLRARILHGLAAVHFRRDDYVTAEPLATEAARLLGHEESPVRRGHVRLMMGNLARMRGDPDTAMTHFGCARMAFEGTGDLLGLAGLDNGLGTLAMTRERFAEALPHLENAAERAAALNSVGNELRNRANIIYAHLNLLDLQAAIAVEPRLNELAAQTNNPQLLLFANLIGAYLRAAQGQHEAAESLLADVLSATEFHEDLLPNRPSALVLLAELAAREGDLARAAHLTAQVVDQVPPDHASMHEELGRAWLISIRANLSLGRPTTAAQAIAALTDWSQRSPVPSAQVYTALAHAELAVAEVDTEEARAAFERALALADASQVPRRVLQVAEVYVPWLLAQDRERAIAVAGRVAGYADQDFDAALLQLHVSHELGFAPAWRGALARARSLAGERQIPAELTEAPNFVALRL